MNKDVAIFFCTYDKAERCFPVLKHSMNKYWPNCKYPVYFTTNFIEGPFGTTLKYGEDEGWSKMMLKLLPQVEAKTIIFMMEDYWLWREVPEDKLAELVGLVYNNVVDYVRLIPSPGATKSFNQSLNEYDKDFMYRTSLGPSIWDKEFFLSLIDANENPWQFEQNSGKRVPDNRKMTAVNEAVLNIVCEYKGSGEWLHEPIEKGNRTEDAYKYLKQEGLDIKL